MSEEKGHYVDLSHIAEGVFLTIDEITPGTFYDIPDEAAENAEARYQLVEGCMYDYEFSDNSFSFKDEAVIRARSRNKHLGTISPNIYVGTLFLEILKDGEPAGSVELEVRSVKATYREDYRYMLGCITDRCVDLIMLNNSIVSHSFETDFDCDSQTLYQRFAFIKSVIESEEFENAVHRIITSPTTKWKEELEAIDVRKVKNFGSKGVRQLIGSPNRLPLAANHKLRKAGITSVAARVDSNLKKESVDTVENRFIKHALQTFLKFCIEIKSAPNAGDRLKNEAELVISSLDEALQYDLFKTVSRPKTLKLNSPVLQRKEGYREILKAWLMFDLAAKLVWKGGEDVYKGGKRDIATLYEYWLFFILLDLFSNKFDIEPKELNKLITETDSGLGLQIRQGEHTALDGIYDSGNRKLNVRFNYNRSFKGKSDYPKPESYTISMRPDYTLSIWPHGIDERAAETTEQIVHIHFDAKYKLDNFRSLVKDQSTNDHCDDEELIDKRLSKELNQQKEDNRKGVYKNADILKMHAYKDAIRRTAGAYVLYPGDKDDNLRGFREVLPGLGAFPVKPSPADNSIRELESFIDDVINHFLNRASKREYLAAKTYEVHKHKNEDVLRESVPEYVADTKLIPNETFVLIGYCKSNDHYKWIKDNEKYNLRLGTEQGCIKINKETMGAKYLLLHSQGDDVSSELWEIVSKGGSVWSKDQLGDDYPFATHHLYYVVELKKVEAPEFAGLSWAFKKLKGYPKGKRGAPFTTCLHEFMKTKKEKVSL